MTDITQFSTAELVAELKTRHELCPVLDEMTRDPMCLFVTTTESLVKELSKRDGVEITVASARDYYEVCINRKDSDYPEPPMDYGPAKILVVRE